ncbi:uncharacterized protein LOC134037063 [Osmerus eperlanus]|uniref:uncharacterized protein LOC134037063 n=1 Tax=Osmerus eperlanus TaxID=29151 RepID=UPI002E114C63
MLAVSVDGNRKLYRFKSNASTSEHSNFEDIFILKDEEVADFVSHVHRRTSHVSEKGACGSSAWTAAKELSRKSTSKLDEEGLSVMHAKAHTGKCEIKWGGAFQEGAGSTIGEEVEQVNSFLSRAAITTKYMSKAGRTDMLTLLAWGWNKRKVENMGRTLSQRYLKTVRMLKEQVESLDDTKDELGVDDSTMQSWVCDVQQWAEETHQSDGSLGALQARIEELAVIIKVRSQNLYRQTDSNKRRHKIRKVILDEKKRLSTAVDDYNKLAEPPLQIVSLDAILQTDTWPWQNIRLAADLQTKRKVFEKVMAVRRLKEEEMLLCKEMQQHWTVMKAQHLKLGTISSNSSFADMSEDAQKGLRCLVLKKQTELKAQMLKVKDYYSRILSHQPLLDIDSEEEEMPEENDAADSDFSTSDED